MALKPMNPITELFCIVTLGLVCGWYQFLLVVTPFVGYYALSGSLVAIALLTALVVFSITPLNHNPNTTVMYSWVFRLWR